MSDVEGHRALRSLARLPVPLYFFDQMQFRVVPHHGQLCDDATKRDFAKEGDAEFFCVCVFLLQDTVHDGVVRRVYVCHFGQQVDETGTSVLRFAFPRLCACVFAELFVKPERLS